MADQTMMTKEASQSTHSRESLVFHIRHRRGLMNVSQPKQSSSTSLQARRSPSPALADVGVETSSRVGQREYSGLC